MVHENGCVVCWKTKKMFFFYFVTIPSFSCSSSGSRFSAQLAGVFKQNIRRFASSFRTLRRHTTNTQNIKTPCSAFSMSVMNLLQLDITFIKHILIRLWWFYQCTSTNLQLYTKVNKKICWFWILAYLWNGSFGSCWFSLSRKQNL